MPMIGAPVTEAEAHATKAMEAAAEKKAKMGGPAINVHDVVLEQPKIMPRMAFRPSPESREAAMKQEAEEMSMKVGGAASKLMPELAKEEDADDVSVTPLLNDNDQRCYAARFSDLKGANALAHYATVGVNQGRLGTCAK